MQIIKKIIFILFLTGLLGLATLVVYNRLSENMFYTLSSVLMAFGLVLYPFRRDFSQKSDVLIIPFVAVFLFTLVNFFVMKQTATALSIVNLLFGLLGFAQYSKQQGIYNHIQLKN